MDNPETLATMGTSDNKRKTNKKQTNITTQKTKKRSNTDLTENRNACAGEGLSVPASYKTPSVLLIYIYIYIYISKSDKNLVRDRGKKIVYGKKKRFISSRSTRSL
jgi:hypothetical protein